MKSFTIAILSANLIMAYAQGDPSTNNKSGETAFTKDDTFKIYPDPSGREYFPKDRESFYTRYLSAMEEPSVQAPLQKGVDKVVRFTYLRNLDDPLAVRITDRGGELRVTAVRLQMDREFHPVTIRRNKTFTLDEGGRKVIKALIESEDFWTPLNLTEKAAVFGGIGGSRWIFEIHDKGGYRMIDVWSPDALTISEADAKVAGIDRSQLRDFLLYKKTGEELLEIGQILPESEDK